MSGNAGGPLGGEGPFGDVVRAIVERLRGVESVLVLVHTNADPDSLGSAAALHYMFPGAVVGLTEGMNRQARTLASSLGLDVVESPVVGDYGLVVCVDASSPEMLGEYGFVWDMDGLVVIDHHFPSHIPDNALAFIDDGRSS
ncbi:MAG: DHH family phosphoesterase, partial [Thermoplasmata archaeon]|nr:DHH family phosphoesterase [Thermoplasmata archaeon]